MDWIVHGDYIFADSSSRLKYYRLFNTDSSTNTKREREIGEKREVEHERERERERGREGEAMKKGRRKGLAENKRNLSSHSYGVPKSEKSVSRTVLCLKALMKITSLDFSNFWCLQMSLDL